MRPNALKLLTLISAFAFAAGCSTISSVSGGPRDDFAAGSALAGQLSAADRAALADAFIDAMESGEMKSWRGNKAVGAVTPEGYSLANLKADPNERIALARSDIELTHVMETDLGLYVLTRNSNIRTGPGTDYKVATVLPAGSGVDVVGGLVDKNWMLVAADGVVRGYVFADLLTKAPGTELELAGGPRRAPVLCREFTQRVSAFSHRDEWTGAACQGGAGWRLAAEPAPPPVEDDPLLGL